MGGDMKPSVLVVDDAADNREALAIHLRGEGYRVDEACDGEDALALVMRDPPDVIVMDLAMPLLDGVEATRLIKRNPNTAAIRIIVVTGHATDTNLHRARAVGVDAVLKKPCLPEVLVAEVRKSLQAKSAMASPQR